MGLVPEIAPLPFVGAATHYHVNVRPWQSGGYQKTGTQPARAAFSGDHVHPKAPKASKASSARQYFFTGNLKENGAQIIYVEGDRDVKLSEGLSIGEFAKMNGGDFLVVTAKVQEVR